MNILRSNYPKMPAYLTQIVGPRLRTCIRLHERGLALVELALVIPFFLILMVGTFEIGRALNQYLILTQIAYEGVRVGSQMTDVEKACFGDFVYGDVPPTDPPYTGGQLSHKVVLDRVGYLLQLQQSGLSVKCDEIIDPGCNNSGVANLPSVTTQYNPVIGASPNCNPPADKGHIAVKISGKYLPLLLPATFAIPLHVSADSVLLMENEGYSVGLGTEISILPEVPLGAEAG